MIGTILQPTYLPWLGYFEMIASADIFVVYDHVQFVKKSWHNRNYIKGPNGKILLSVPTKKSPLYTPMFDIELASEYEKALSDHWVSISHAYRKAPYFDHYSASLETLYHSKYSLLTELSVSFIRYFCNELGITTPFINSSRFLSEISSNNPTERVVQLCQKTNITSLYDANGAINIIDTNVFDEYGIDIQFQNYSHPTYSQLFGGFLPYMSILDILLNEGPNSLDIVKSGRRNPIIKYGS